MTERKWFVVDCDDSVSVPDMCERGVDGLGVGCCIKFFPLTKAEADEIKSYMQEKHPSVEIIISKAAIQRARKR